MVQSRPIDRHTKPRLLLAHKLLFTSRCGYTQGYGVTMPASRGWWVPVRGSRERRCSSIRQNVVACLCSFVKARRTLRGDRLNVVGPSSEGPKCPWACHDDLTQDQSACSNPARCNLDDIEEFCAPDSRPCNGKDRHMWYPIVRLSLGREPAKRSMYIEDKGSRRCRKREVNPPVPTVGRMNALGRIKW